MTRGPGLILIFCALLFCTQLYGKSDTSDVNRLNNIAWKLRHSQLDSATKLSKVALNILDSLPVTMPVNKEWKDKAYAKTLYYLGTFYGIAGYSKIPLEYFLKAQKIAVASKDLHYESQCFTGIGNYYMNHSDFSKSLENHLQALRIDEKRGFKKGIAIGLSNIGNVYDAKGEFKQSMVYYKRAHAIAVETEDSLRIAIQLGNIGIAHYKLGETQRAVEYFKQAYDLCKIIGDKDGMARNLNNMASTFQDGKQFPRAIEYYTQALALAEEQGNKDNLSTFLGNIGTVYMFMGDYPRAESDLKKAIAIATEIDVQESVQEFELTLSEVYSKWGKEKLALEHYKNYVTAKDKVFNTANTEKLVRAEMSYNFEQEQARQQQEHEKQVIAFEAKNKVDSMLRVFLICVIALGLVTLFFIQRAYENKKRIADFLEKESQRKEVLLQEVHHRINNNLQVISSLLSLQASSVGDEKLNMYLEQSQQRIQSLSTLHEMLFQNSSPLEINMREYLNKVLDFHREVMQAKTPNVGMEADIASVNFTTKLAVPIALIVNELVTNSFKYAFRNEAHGSINVSLVNESSNKWILKVSDDGAGLPGDSEHRKDSLGLRLVNLLAKQLGSVFTKSNTPGATFIFSFHV